MFKKSTIYIISIFILIFNIVVFKFPKEIINASTNGLLMWGNRLVPSLLPFIFINNLAREFGVFHLLGNLLCSPLSRLLKISNISSISYISALLSGYPIGAKLVSENYISNDISMEEAKRVSYFTNTASPLFILGTVGTILLNNKYYGIYLLIIQIFSSLLLGLILAKSQKTTYSTLNVNVNSVFKASDNPSALLSLCITNSISTITIIGCYVIILSVVTEIFTILGVLNAMSYILCLLLSPLGFDLVNTKAIIIGFFEMTSGVVYLSNSKITPINIAIISFILSFGGLSINFQCLSFLQIINISNFKFLLYKLIQATISFIIVLLTFDLVNTIII